MSNIDSVSGAASQYKYSTSAASAGTGPTMQDFMLLIVAQMQNQDMFSEQDNSQFMAQMAQMASMQAMQDLTTAFMSSMAMSYIGKYAKASAYAYDESGNNLQAVNAEGYVDMVNFNGGKAMVLIGETWFNVSDVYEIRAAAPEPEKKEFEGSDAQ
jgi:flagellar basal-body rod modification protein FlgD